MATVIGTFLTAAGVASTANIRCERLAEAGVITGGQILGPGVVVAAAADMIDTGATLGQGTWRLTWWDGPKSNFIDITVPTGDGTYEVVALVDGVDAGFTMQQWFADPDALAAVTISDAIQTVYFVEDSNTPPARGVLFRREATEDEVDGIRVAADLAGTTFVRYDA